MRRRAELAVAGVVTVLMYPVAVLVCGVFDLPRWLRRQFVDLWRMLEP